MGDQSRWWWRIDNLSRALEFTLRWEGGYVNNPHDPGGATKYGISQRAFPDLDIENLTLEQAKEIYRTKYWEAIQGDERPFSEAVAIFDFAVHSGVYRALVYWDQTKDVGLYMAARLDFLTSLDSFNTFGRGWVRRVNDLRRLTDQNQLNVNQDVELIQLYFEDRRYDFYPVKTSVGVTSNGRPKIMARLK